MEVQSILHLALVPVWEDTLELIVKIVQFLLQIVQMDSIQVVAHVSVIQ